MRAPSSAKTAGDLKRPNIGMASDTPLVSDDTLSYLLVAGDSFGMSHRVEVSASISLVTSADAASKAQSMSFCGNVLDA